MQHNVPLKVRSTFDDSPGTLITTASRPDSWSRARGDRVVAGVTHLASLCRFLVPSDGTGMTHIKAFRRLADQGISVDMVSVTPAFYSFVVKKDVTQQAEQVMSHLGFAGDLAVLHDCAKVSIVGSGMRGLPGVMANVAEALHEAGVEILQTADSHMTISCLIGKADLGTAAQALHRRFGLDKARKTDREAEVPQVPHLKNI